MTPDRLDALGIAQRRRIADGQVIDWVARSDLGKLSVVSCRQSIDCGDAVRHVRGRRAARKVAARAGGEQTVQHGAVGQHQQQYNARLEVVED
jgi:hypothetical protein